MADGPIQGCRVAREGGSAGRFEPIASAGEVASVRADVVARAAPFGAAPPIRTAALSIPGGPDPVTYMSLTPRCVSGRPERYRPGKKEGARRWGDGAHRRLQQPWRPVDPRKRQSDPRRGAISPARQRAGWGSDISVWGVYQHSVAAERWIPGADGAFRVRPDLRAQLYTVRVAVYGYPPARIRPPPSE